jgi:hypothetical protein
MKKLTTLVIPLFLVACGGSPEYYTPDGSDVNLTNREAELINECLPRATSRWSTSSKVKTKLFARDSNGFRLWVTDAAMTVKYIEDKSTGKKKIDPSSVQDQLTPKPNVGSCRIDNDKIAFIVSNTWTSLD